jgi:cellobiose-specific phosphotransferase system component IIC
MKQYGEGSMISGLLSLLVFVLVAVNLIAPVANAQVAATNNANVTGAAASLTGLMTTLFVAVILVAVTRFV